MKITKVVFEDGSGEPVIAMYLNNKLFKYNDSYHYNMNVYIQGFIDSAKMFEEVIFKDIRITDSNICNDICELAYSPNENMIYEETIS